MSAPGAARRRGLLLEGAGVLLVSVAVVAHSVVSEDLHLWDETYYLARGVDPQRFGIPGWEDSSAYSAMYGALSAGFSDRIDLYFAGRAASALLMVLGLYLATRLISTRRMAFVAAGVMATLPLTYIWPGVAGPAAGAVCVAVAVVARWASPLGLGAASVLVWFAAASRPEFTWVALAMSLGLLVWVAWSWWRTRQRPRPREVAVALVVGAALPLIIAFRYGNYLAPSPRQWTAFTQHFALRHAAPGQDPWISAQDIANTYFPNAYTIPEALRANPAAFAEHVASNTILMPLTLAGHALGAGEAAPTMTWLGRVVAGLFAVAVVLSAVLNRSTLWAWCRSLPRRAWAPQRRVTTLAIVAIVVGIVVPQIVIYPRPHYLLLPIGLLVMVACYAMGRAPDSRWQVALPFGSTLLGVLVLLAVSVFGIPARMAEAPSWEAGVRALAQSGKPVRIASVEPTICVYLPKCTALAQPSDPQQEFSNYLDEQDVNAILAVPIFASSGWGSLPGAAGFLEDPSAYGFEPIVPGAPILVRSP